jgi:2-polyprenyl-3-methyl-5-hydroxy-6-metoxy-1,4-benzoquinol methylase
VGILNYVPRREDAGRKSPDTMLHRRNEFDVVEKKPSIEEQALFYDEKWGAYQYANSLERERIHAILGHIVETQFAYPRCVDLGAGAGALAGILGTFGPTLGVELSPAAVEQARQRFPYAQFVAGDLFGWKPDVEYDIAVSQEVLEHLEDQPRFCRLAYTALRPGGYFIVTTPNAPVMRAMEQELGTAWSQQPVEDWVTAGELRTMLRDAGFTDIRISTIILGMTRRGIHRLVNSSKILALLASIGIKTSWEAWARRAGFGLHLVARARKPGR